MFRSESRSLCGRFSLLLLEEGEYYFEEHRALRQHAKGAEAHHDEGQHQRG
jgi:hypothetical protein